MNKLSLFSVFLMAASGSGQAGIVLKGKTQATVSELFGGTHQAKSEYVLFLEDDRFRQDIRSEKENYTVIVRSDKKVLWVANHKKKTYLEMDEKKARALKKQMDELRKDKNAAKLMDAMMGAATKMMRVDRWVAAGSDSVNGRSCQKHIGMRGNEKVMEACVISAGMFSTAKDVIAKSKRASKFMTDMFPDPSIQKMVSSAIDSSAMHLGFPIRVNYYMGKNIRSKSEVTELNSKWLMDKSQFEIPAGYRKEG